jgi:hypothetical protein
MLGNAAFRAGFGRALGFERGIVKIFRGFAQAFGEAARLGLIVI